MPKYYTSAMRKRLIPVLAVVVFCLLFLTTAGPNPSAQGQGAFDAGLFRELQWRNIGPHRGSRTKAIDGVPGQPHTFYIGVVNGGIWKTTDAGRTWAPILTVS